MLAFMKTALLALIVGYVGFGSVEVPTSTVLLVPGDEFCKMEIYFNINVVPVGTCNGQGSPCTVLDGTCKYTKMQDGGMFGTSIFECQCDGSDQSLACCNAAYYSRPLAPNTWDCSGSCTIGACTTTGPELFPPFVSADACSCE